MKENKKSAKKSSAASTGQNQSNPAGSSDSLWLKRGEEDVSYQRQTQLTWWTLLGGIAVGALLTQLESLLVAVKSGQWYYLFYFFATCFLIINTFVTQAWGAIVLRCPISVEPAIYTFFATLSSSIAALNITHPAIWTTAVGFVVLFSTVLNLYYLRQKAMLKEAIPGVKKGLIMFGLFIIIAAVESVVLFLFPSTWTELIIGLLDLILTLIALYSQHVGMEIEKKLYAID